MCGLHDANLGMEMLHLLTMMGVCSTPVPSIERLPGFTRLSLNRNHAVSLEGTDNRGVIVAWAVRKDRQRST